MSMLCLESSVTVNTKNYPSCSSYTGDVNTNRLDSGLRMALIYISRLFAFSFALVCCNYEINGQGGRWRPFLITKCARVFHEQVDSLHASAGILLSATLFPSLPFKAQYLPHRLLSKPGGKGALTDIQKNLRCIFMTSPSLTWTNLHSVTPTDLSGLRAITFQTLLNMCYF